jgi:hypothetical protein
LIISLVETDIDCHDLDRDGIVDLSQPAFAALP